MNKHPGYWIAAESGVHFTIDDHAQWVLKKDNAMKLGLSEALYNSIKDMCPAQDRLRILVNVLASGYIRMRSYGSHVTFEYTSYASLRSQQEFLQIILEFLTHHYEVGDFTEINLHNIALKKGLRATWMSMNKHTADVRPLIMGMEPLVERAVGSDESVLISTCFEELCILPRKYFG